ncbi:MAG: DEAD/DEAH box helicase [Candidatus Thermoplasmatota archaeon]|nr:DEAD/DEAH box helicase [Candidatus Thermoplasmatota archaeon]
MSSISFSDWDLPEYILDALAVEGWEKPTQIQREAIPAARNGSDIIGQAKTGSGKTAAFGIPIIERSEPTGHPQSIVLCPTRELATQVCNELQWIQGDKGLIILSVYGGTDLEKQAQKLDSGVDIIVGTPGRIIDMTKRKHLNLQSISLLCLDEADRMLDMGFWPDISWIFSNMPERNQTLLFSATFPQEIIDSTDEFLKNPVTIMSDDLEVEVPEIDQKWIRIGRANKLWGLGRILVNMDSSDQCLIFCNTKRMVELLEDRLGKHRFSTSTLHGDMSQNKREKVMLGFRDSEIKILIATDVAARGLDVDGVTIVINYDLPDNPEDYVHRIGRTGRMGKKGNAWSFVGREDLRQLERIRSTWNLNIVKSDAPELPAGVDRDPVRPRKDWAESSDPFGMVQISINAGLNLISSKLSLSEWIISQAKIKELAIGEISINEKYTTVDIHAESAQRVLEILERREYNGTKLAAELAIR